MIVRALTFGLLLLLPPGAVLAAGGPPAELWARFKQEFISPDGRVIDFFQNRMSHSEGQGYAMLIAQTCNDRAGFDLIWNWAVNNLQVRKTDRLFAWSWGRDPDGQWTVLDRNNATDGDILIAWALLRAADRWPGSNYRAKATPILDDLLTGLTREKGGLTFLLPGKIGFELEDGTMVLNPSYFLFPAYRRFAQTHDNQAWIRLFNNAKALLRLSRFGRIGLPADWVVFDGRQMKVYTDKSNAFGFDAVRTPLYLTWAGLTIADPWVGRYLDLVARLGYLPASYNLIEDQPSPRPGPAGFYAVFSAVAARLNRPAQSRTLADEASRLALAEKHDYYSTVLRLLAASGLDQ